MTITTRHDKRHSHRLGFVTFHEPSSLTAALQQTPHTIAGRSYDVKRAYSKEDESASSSAASSLPPSDPAESLAEPSPPGGSAGGSAGGSKRSKDRRASLKGKPAGSMGLGGPNVPNVPNVPNGVTNVPNGVPNVPNIPNGVTNVPNVPNGLNGVPGPLNVPNVPNGVPGRAPGGSEEGLRGSVRELAGLEFFDEQDNNPLPATYTQAGGLPPFASAGLPPFQQPAAFREGVFQRGELGLQPSPRFYTQHDADLYGGVDPDWSLELAGSFFDGPAPHAVAAAQFGSVPGDPEGLAFGARRLARHDSLPSSLPPGHGGLFGAQRDSGMFDSISSAGSHSTFARPFFPSQHVPYYENYLATDPGNDEFAAAPGFFSNGGIGSGGLMGDIRDADYYNSSFDDALMGAQPDKFTWSQFTDWSGKEIDSIL